MMKMRKDNFYEELWKKTAGNPGFNKEFVNQTNQYNVGEKREYILMIYDKLKVSPATYGKKYLPVQECPEEVIDRVFKRLFADMIKYKKGEGLASIVTRPQTDRTEKKGSQLELSLSVSDPKAFEKHLAALDGYHWNKNRDYPSLAIRS